MSVSRSYQDREGKWQRTTGHLDEGDLLAAAKAIEDCYVAIQKKRRDSRQEGLDNLQAPQGSRAAY